MERRRKRCRPPAAGACGRRAAGAALAAAMLLLGACAAAPRVPYPAFVQADELQDVFLASLPGTRAKQFAGDSRTRQTSNRLALPAQWRGTTGATPTLNLELYVLAGAVRLDDLDLDAGGYAFFPAGWRSVDLRTQSGALLLYFLSDAAPDNVIQTPLVTSTRFESWVPHAQIPGVFTLELRHDPGSGARTWLERVTPEARLPWRAAARVVEGYLVAGHYRESECVAGQPVTGEYTPGGYFIRPGGALHGGPASRAVQPSVWLLRTTGHGETDTVGRCRAAPAR
ncbi:MAG TPA: DUF4437 domain-containing protein [Woeseiaceae bacterium]|nr:DUF4437 domain-containing protein [Woeseiaceae bacterium]